MKEKKANKTKSYSIPYVFKNLFSRILPRKRKQVYLLVAGMLGTAVIETITLGLIAFFISSLSSPENALQSNYVEKIYKKWKT